MTGAFMAKTTVDQPAAAVRALRQEIAALEHELRRVRDGLERSPSHALEQRAGQLRENITLCRKQLEQHLDGKTGSP